MKLWNGRGEACTGLVVGAYACISIIQPTETVGPNSVTTPLLT